MFYDYSFWMKQLNVLNNTSFLIATEISWLFGIKTFMLGKFEMFRNALSIYSIVNVWPIYWENMQLEFEQIFLWLNETFKDQKIIYS
jgi:hypothetical protein